MQHSQLSPAQRFRRLLRLQGMYSLFAAIHWSLVFLFLVIELGMPLMQVLIVPALIYLSSIGLLLVLPKMEYRNALRLGFLFRVLAIVPFWLWPTPTGIFLASVSFGLAVVLFWVPYNIMFFEHRQRTNKAGISAIYMIVAPFIEILAALIAGLVAAFYGFNAVFIVAIVFGIVPLFNSMRLHAREATPIDLFHRLSQLRRLRTLIVLDGLQQGVAWAGVPLITLLFLTGPFEYGAFLAAIGLGSALAAIFIGSLSDRRGKRVVFLVPFAFVAALGHVGSAFAGSVVAFGIARAVAQAGHAVFEPFKNTVLLDVAEDVTNVYIGREFLLNVGRALGVGVLAVFGHMGALQMALIVPALATIVYPIVIEVKDLYPTERIMVLKPRRTMLDQ